jgi:Protein of unknown function (DUF1800)
MSESASAPPPLAESTPRTADASKALPRPTEAEASRFLAQAGFATTYSEVIKVQNMGYSAWLDEQFRASRTQGHYAWLKANGYVKLSNRSNFSGIDNSFWRKLISSDDLLPQCVVLALSEIFVVSLTGLQTFCAAPWLLATRTC